MGIMMRGVLRMPYEMAMDSELSRRQFYDRAQQAMDEIESLRAQLSSMQPNETIQISVLDSPKKIWLNIGDTDFEEVKENNWRWDDMAKITWCSEKIDQCDIPYIRADLAPLSTEVLVEALREIANSSHSSAGGSRIANEALEFYEAKLLHKEG